MELTTANIPGLIKNYSGVKIISGVYLVVIDNRNRIVLYDVDRQEIFFFGTDDSCDASKVSEWVTMLAGGLDW